ncbi:ABC transporter substrate-binding protein [Rhodopseudomonas palustris]|uniref:ABC transporter substrate-binding protein n=1 Tax=Rhodopseudomonas palustris TaxID=1076 RepID=UPI002ACDA51F|nr:ABC transporter substrate-binding protein [Rhodopseudomonas palustris]WQH00321.1 ABC transporter substrate-binding protein [Rhodopseudomonas palustris]
MNSPIRHLKRVLLFGALVLAAGTALPGPAIAASARIASINMCTDQLLIALADPVQIVGLGPYARDPHLSWSAKQARSFPRLSGEAEDLLLLAPDIVLAGRYGKAATRELLRSNGIAIEEFDVPRNIDDVKAQIRRVGDLAGHPERADAIIARIDRSVARTRAMASRWRDRILPVSRRGWIAGSDGLLSSLLEVAGLSNAAAEIGLTYGGFASLETIVASRPDLLLVADDKPFAEDQGKALLLHPAIQRAYPPNRRLVFPDQLTMCGGPMLPDALDQLADSIARIHQDEDASVPRQHP